MKRTILPLLFLGVASCSSLPDASASPCVAMKIDCAASDVILVVGNVEEQGALLNTALASAKRFESIFGVSPAKTVIVPGGEIKAKQSAAFKEAGYPVQLPWISASDKVKLREASIRRQVEEQTKDLPAAIRESAIKQALAAVQKGAQDANAQAIQDGAFAHELGHMWFINAFRPADGELQKGHAYGGWAPDWLDETAAVLMENSVLTEKRREAFGALSADEIIPLRQFLTMEHPAAKSAMDLQKTLTGKRSKGESRAIVLSGKDAEDFLKKSGGDKAANFYAQVQAFSDFLLSKTNDSAVYRSLTEALLSGGSFSQWLSDEGASWNLPPSLEALEREWNTWLNTQE